MDVVVSYYQEDIQNLSNQLSRILAHPKMVPLAPCVTIYSKGGRTEEVAKAIPWANVIPLPNVGRESHTYLHHMETHYEDLPAHMMFVHGHVEHMGNLLRVLSALTPTTGFMCLAYFGRSTCDGGELHPDRRMREVWALARRDFCFDDFNICYRAHFLVSAARVRHHGLGFYRRLREIHELPADHIIYKDAQQLADPAVRNGWGPSNPLLAHTFERAWTFLFNCHYPSGPSQVVPQLLPMMDPTRACRCFMDPNIEPLHIGEPGDCSYDAMRQGCQCVDMLPHARHHKAAANASQQL
jgi:hypothetical protein